MFYAACRQFRRQNVLFLITENHRRETPYNIVRSSLILIFAPKVFRWKHWFAATYETRNSDMRFAPVPNNFSGKSLKKVGEKKEKVGIFSAARCSRTVALKSDRTAGKMSSWVTRIFRNGKSRLWSRKLNFTAANEARKSSPINLIASMSFYGINSVMSCFKRDYIGLWIFNGTRVLVFLRLSCLNCKFPSLNHQYLSYWSCIDNITIHNAILHQNYWIWIQFWG